MLRAMTGYLQDDAGDWVAKLICGHRQHVRHKPPFFSRPWTQSPEGRASMLGQALDCVRCDRRELPEGLIQAHRTTELDEHSIPEDLRNGQATQPGLWVVIHVVAGQLCCCLDGLAGQRLRLDAQTAGVVAPDVAFQVEPEGPVRFWIELLRPAD